MNSYVLSSHLGFREDALTVLGKLFSHWQPHFGLPAEQPYLIAFVALFPGPVLLFCFGLLLGFVKFSLLWFWPAFSCGLQLVHILRGLFSSSPFSLYTILLHLSKRKIRNRPLASVWMKKKVDKTFNSPNLHCRVFFTCLFLLFSVFFKSNWILRFWLGPTPQRNPSMWTWGKFRIPNCAAGSFIKWFWTGQGC